MDLKRLFLDYADAFEQSVASDDWTKVAEYFSENAEYIAIDGQRSRGRAQIIRAFKTSVDSIDRRFDKRIVRPLAPTFVSDNSLTMDWQNTFAKNGAPNLVVSGTGQVSYEGELIQTLHDQLDEGVGEQLGIWMSEHGEKLA